MKCQEWSEELEDDPVVLKVGRKRMKLCEECAETIQEELDIADEAESAMQGMMEYKGR